MENNKEMLKDLEQGLWFVHLIDEDRKEMRIGYGKIKNNRLKVSYNFIIGNEIICYGEMYCPVDLLRVTEDKIYIPCVDRTFGMYRTACHLKVWHPFYWYTRCLRKKCPKVLEKIELDIPLREYTENWKRA